MSKFNYIAPPARNKPPVDVYIFFGILIACFVLVVAYSIALYMK